MATMMTMTMMKTMMNILQRQISRTNGGGHLRQKSESSRESFSCKIKTFPSSGTPDYH